MFKFTSKDRNWKTSQKGYYFSKIFGENTGPQDDNRCFVKRKKSELQKFGFLDYPNFRNVELNKFKFLYCKAI